MTNKKRVPPAAALETGASPKVAARTKLAQQREPVQLRYQLGQWVAERRNDGWWVAKAWTSTFGEKPKWEGPFAFPQDAAIAIARHLCAELSNRHQAKAGFYQVKPTDPLFGLPPLPDLSSRAKRGERS